MAPETLQQRREEFQKICEQRKINWKEHVKAFPNDDHGLILLGLATLLKVSLQGAFSARSFEDLESESRAFDEESKGEKE
jgi:hypothetical protein